MVSAAISSRWALSLPYPWSDHTYLLGLGLSATLGVLWILPPPLLEQHLSSYHSLEIKCFRPITTPGPTSARSPFKKQNSITTQEIPHTWHCRCSHTELLTPTTAWPATVSSHSYMAHRDSEASSLCLGTHCAPQFLDIAKETTEWKKIFVSYLLCKD
jgi:hypothetical protein